jgi:hypothetical protein
MLYYNGSLIIKILFREAWRQSNFLIRYRKYKFLDAKKMRFYEPQRHNAANAARKGVHEKINKNPLCPLRLCGSIRFIGFFKDA